MRLQIAVRFHDARFHGAGPWPPAPARLFQALVAAAARGTTVGPSDREALGWLEGLDAPEIAAPPARPGQRLVSFVPNNDLDALGGDPARVPEIKTDKRIQPWLLPEGCEVVYSWTVGDGEVGRHGALAVCELTKRVYQLGRGVDMAWARAGVAPEDQMAQGYDGMHVYRPGESGGLELACPEPGSLASLLKRYQAAQHRLGRSGKTVTLTNPPPPRFRVVSYDASPRRFMFELRRDEENFAPWPASRAVEMVLWARDGAAARLTEALPPRAAEIRRVLVASKRAAEHDKAERVRMVPLPSIGHPHADGSIRRLLVEVPARCPLGGKDIAWAFSGLTRADGRSGEVLWELVPAEIGDFLGHFVPERGARAWHSVTPLALPAGAAFRGERQHREEGLATAVAQALRHAGVYLRPIAIAVQREPFEIHGATAESYAANRFGAERLHHVRITFSEPVTGPLVLGDGRYLGLGVMAPEPPGRSGVACYRLEGSVGPGGRELLLRAVRRALMSLAGGECREVPRLFSGHEPGGAAAASGQHDHVFLALMALGAAQLLVVAAPWACDRSRAARDFEAELFECVCGGLREARAGALGVIRLGPAEFGCAPGRLMGPARVWVSQTPFRPTRHGRRREPPEETAAGDLAAECRRRGLPCPAVQILRAEAGPNGGGLVARARLEFAVAVRGPILLGRDSHAGGGLFLAEVLPPKVMLSPSGNDN
ncbi:MAG: type I-G CRISPR-associated protein Csb2 [Terriglobales bacterium]